MAEHGLAQRVQRLGCPAAAHVADAAKACLVLKHQSPRLAVPRLSDVLERWGSFFHSSCATGSLCGWRLSGAGLRQLCIDRRQHHEAAQGVFDGA